MTEHYLEQLVEKYAQGKASEEETRQLMDWYHAATINEVQWKAEAPGEKQAVYKRMLDQLHKKIAPKKTGVLHFSWAKIAAVLILIIGAWLLILQLGNPFSREYITVNNPPGNIQLVHLPDSSKVWLNANTVLRYAKAFLTNRKLILTGEAYFEVKHDANHPFSIETGNVTTTVRGTSFNIKAYDEENQITISVSTGRIQVSGYSKDSAILQPSMQMQLDKQQRTAAITTIDTGSIAAWKKGRLQFEGQTLATITAALERWYKVKIVFTNPAIADCRYYMGFDNTIPLPQLLSVMSEVTKMQYSMDEKTATITFSGKGCE